MAELGLAIAGVSTAAAALGKELLDIYKSARDSYKDAGTLSNHLLLLQSILQELEKTFDRTRSIWSEDAKATTSDLLDACKAIFDQLNKTLQPYGSYQEGTSKTSLANRFKWHFKKDEVRSLTTQLDSIKTTLQLMISVILLGDRMNQDPESSPALHARLYMASQLVVGERASLANLLLVEEYIACTSIGKNDMTTHPNSSHPPRSDRDGRIFEWLNKIVGLSQDGGLPFDEESRSSLRSAVVLTDEQRSIAGAGSNDVENLLEKWTTLSESYSKSTEYEMVDERISRLSTRSRSLTNCAGESSLDNNQDPKQLIENPVGPLLDASKRSQTDGLLQPPEPSGFINGESAKVSSLHSNLQSPLPTAEEHINDDDNETVRDITGEEDIGQARSSISLVESASTSVVENWILDQGSDAGDATMRAHVQEHFQNFNNYRGPFSEISILETSRSQAPSVISTISSMGTSSDPKRIKKLIKLGKNLFRMKKYNEALTLYREAYQEKKELGEEDSEMVDIEFQLGVIFGELNKYQEAEKLLQRVLKKQKRRHAGSAMHLTEHYLGRVLSRQQKWKESFATYTLLWQARKPILEEINANKDLFSLALRTGCEYGNVLLHLQMYDDALSVFNVVHPLSKEHLGEANMKVTMRSALDLAKSQIGVGEVSGCRNLLVELCGTALETFGGNISFLTDCKYELAMVACLEGKHKEAETLARTVLRQRRDRHGRENIETLTSAHRLSIILKKSGKPEGSKEILEEYQPIAKELLGNGHSITINFALHLAEILEGEGQDEEAESILSSAYHSLSTSTEIAKVDRLSVAVPLGQLMIRGLEKPQIETEYKLKQERFLGAIRLFDFIYPTQKQFSGPQSETTLKSGHQYGTLCLQAGCYTQAVTVLQEVWDNRNKAFGKEDPRSVESGLKLGKVFLWQNKHDEAFQIFQPLFNTTGALSGLSTSLQNIESAELLGFLQLSRARETRQVDDFDAWKLIDASFEARKQLDGSSSTDRTLVSAMQLGALNFANGKLEKAQEHFNWVFSEAVADQNDINKYDLGIMSGLNSSVIAFIRNERRVGNDIFGQVIQLSVQHKRSAAGALTRALSYAQASFYFLQQERQASVSVLRKIFSSTRRDLGGRHIQTCVAGELLSLGLILDSLLTTNTITNDVDRIIDKITSVTGERSLLPSICLVIAISLAVADKETLAKPLLTWLHKLQKRRFGRFSKEALTILAIMHGTTIRKMYHKTKGIPKSEETFLDIGAEISSSKFAWDPLMSKIADRVAKLSRNPGDNKFERRLAKSYARAVLWEKFEQHLAALEVIQQVSDFVGPRSSGMEIFSNLPHVNSFVGGRAETIYSDSDFDDDKKEFDSETVVSVDFGGILGDIKSVPLQSLGASLIDLSTMMDDDDSVEDAMSRIVRLQDELVDEIVDDADIRNARDNVEKLEKEAGVTV